MSCTSFLSGEAAAIGVGNGVTVRLTDAGEQVGHHREGGGQPGAGADRRTAGAHVTISVPNQGADRHHAGHGPDRRLFGQRTAPSRPPWTTMNSLSTGVEVEAVLWSTGGLRCQGYTMFTHDLKSADKLIQS